MNNAEYLKLVETINYHMNLYYNLDEPEISDYEYDMLMASLKVAEREHPEWVTKDSPTQKIGGVAKREAGIKVTHDVPMLSIEDVFNKEDVIAWVEKVHAIHPDCTFSVEPKIDGLSATLRYEKGDDDCLHLTMCETRGDGYQGEACTENALMIPSVPKIIRLPYDSLQIRGEVYMTHENFERYNAHQEKAGKKLAANPRNLAAGTLRQLDPMITKERGLDIMIFNVQKGPSVLMKDHVGGLQALGAIGVPTTSCCLCKNSEEVIAAIDAIANMRTRLNYDIDGAVVKINEIEYRDDFPSGSKYSAGHIAYKYPPEEKIVVMDNIVVDVGRTGKMTFTGEFHDKTTGGPAKLCGTSVSRATLHNQDYIEDMKIGVGGSYKLFKSGEIIPKLNGCVDEPAEVFKAPTKCPVCGSELIRELDTADIYCINPSCPAQLTRTIEYFASLNCMNIMGLGETLVDALVGGGYLTSYADIYTLKDKREDLIREGVVGKEKNTDKILKEIEKSKDNDAIRLLTALGIRNVGRSTAKEIMGHYASIQDLMKASVEDLTQIDNVGEITANYIVDFFVGEKNRELISQLEAAGVNMAVQKAEGATNKLTGMTIVVTGTLPTLGRKEATELIEKNGGKCSGSVSKKTTMVLAGEAAGSKLTKAQELGIKIITEEELLEMLK